MFEGYNKDTEYMPPVAAATFAQVHKNSSILLIVIFVFFVIFLMWANVAEIDQRARGQGRVIPSKDIQEISHLEGGIIKKIFVDEGQVVKKKEVLAVLDNKATEARLVKGKAEYYRLWGEEVRLETQIAEKNKLKLPDEIKKSAPQVAEQTMQNFKDWQDRLKNERSIAKQKSKQKEQELLELESNLKQLKEQISLSQEEININEPLYRQGLVPKIDFIKLKRDMSELKGKKNGTEISISKAKAAIDQAKNEFNQVAINIMNENKRELRQIKGMLAKAQEEFSTETDRTTRMQVVSPVNGVVKSVLISTEGSVVKPGDVIFEIVPTDDKLLIEAEIKPADIGMLKIGDKASVKITAYDFSIYGGLHGEVKSISADSFTDKRGRTFFKVKVKTDKNYLTDKHGKKLQISTGMVATVDILTGKRTILQYLLKPIIKGMDAAFTER